MAEKQKILIADDDPEIREVVRVLLESEGFEVAEAKDGIEAVRMADDSVDLILLDIMMPGQSGFAACLDIRKNTQAPIIFLTAKTQDSDKTMGFSAGGDDYLAKPFSFSELLARVKAALRRYLVYGAKQGGQDSPRWKSTGPTARLPGTAGKCS
jgi:DNA-binding response OmpR family regulator